MDSTGELYFYTELWQVIFCKDNLQPVMKYWEKKTEKETKTKIRVCDHIFSFPSTKNYKLHKPVLYLQ